MRGSGDRRRGGERARRRAHRRTLRWCVAVDCRPHALRDALVRHQPAQLRLPRRQPWRPAREEVCEARRAARRGGRRRMPVLAARVVVSGGGGLVRLHLEARHAARCHARRPHRRVGDGAEGAALCGGRRRRVRQIAAPQDHVAARDGHAPRREPSGAQRGEVRVRERHPLRPPPPRPSHQRRVKSVRAGPALEARVLGRLVGEGRRRLHKLQPRLRRALVKVFAAGARLRPAADVWRRPASCRVGAPCRRSGRAAEGEAFLGGVQRGCAKEAREDALRKPLAQAAEQPARAVVLEHVGKRAPAGVRPRVWLSVGGRVPRLGVVADHGGRDGRHEPPEQLHLCVALLAREHAAKHHVPVPLQRLARRRPKLTAGAEVAQKRVGRRGLLLLLLLLFQLRVLVAGTRHAAAARADLEHPLAVERHAVHRAAPRQHSALPLFEPEEGAADDVHGVAHRVHAQHRRRLERDGVDEPVGRQEAVLPLVAVEVDVAVLCARRDLGPDLDRRRRRRVDPQDVVRVGRDAVDAAVRPEHTTEVLVLSVGPVVAAVREGD
mmetsp:Transcript_16712/g.54078  ORF Transcript_16712/g.54078 Transcript_16712/m.54078 type:complete len:551 (+) Transcript_16712:323-1975(+)